MLDAERRQQLVALVEERNSLTVLELAEHFAVSAATIRRDLSQLAQRGLIERAHGGAARRVRTPAHMPEPPLLKRSSMEAEEKRAIGAAAAQYVRDGETIIISSGTTTAEMIPHLANRQGLTVITNALNITLLLAQYPQITVIVLGGILRHSEMTTLGSLAEQALDNLRADKLFMGTRAVHAEYGISAENLAESHSDQALMKSARDIFVLADHTKFGKIATVRVATLDQVTRLITDGHLPDIELASIAETGVLIDRAG
jgi:DeoR/GlpR family transcriptional regulator of sugar metabolism